MGEAAQDTAALPRPAPVAVRHAPGFEKYVEVAAGEMAHEAG